MDFRIRSRALPCERMLLSGSTIYHGSGWPSKLINLPCVVSNESLSIYTTMA